MTRTFASVWHLCQKPFRKSGTVNKAPRRRAFRPRLEALETRLVPTTINVLWIDNFGFTSGWVTAAFNVTHINMTQFDAMTDLSPYQDLYFCAPDGPLPAPSASAANLVNTFVQNGGGLFLEAAEGTSISWAPLGGSISTTSSPNDNNIVLTTAGQSHPVTSGESNASLSNWNNSQHGTFLSFPSSLTNLESAAGGADPGLLVGTYGSGHLVYSMLDPAYHQEYGSTARCAKMIKLFVL